MNSLITNATNTFASTTGLTLPDVIAFMADQLKLILGTGLAFFQAILPWVVALALLGAVIYFAYRAFRFFRG